MSSPSKLPLCVLLYSHNFLKGMMLLQKHLKGTVPRRQSVTHKQQPQELIHNSRMSDTSGWSHSSLMQSDSLQLRIRQTCRHRHREDCRHWSGWAIQLFCIHLIQGERERTISHISNMILGYIAFHHVNKDSIYIHCCRFQHSFTFTKSLRLNRGLSADIVNVMNALHGCGHFQVRSLAFQFGYFQTALMQRKTNPVHWTWLRDIWMLASFYFSLCYEHSA